MKISRIKKLALAGTLVAGAIMLDTKGCSFQNSSAIIKNEERLKDLNISAKTLDSIKHVATDCELNLNPLDAILGNTSRNYQAVTDSVYWTKKLDSAVAAAKQLAKQAAIDSIEAAKVVK